MLDITVGNGSVFSGNTAGANGGAIASELTTNLAMQEGDNVDDLFENEGANIWIAKMSPSRTTPPPDWEGPSI